MRIAQWGNAGTFSKAWAMTGWRVGWIAAADPTLAARINLVHRTFNGPLSTFIQDAAIRALDLPEEYFTRLRRSVPDPTQHHV